MILGEDPSYLSLAEVGNILGLSGPIMHQMLRRGVYVAEKMSNNVYAIHIDNLPEIADRINAYREKRPYHYLDAVTIEEAAKCLGVSENMIYQLRQKGDLDWAENELKHFISRESLEQLMWRRGLGKPKLTRVV